MAVTSNAQLARKMQLFRSHGITRESSEMTQEPDGPWYYQQIDLGFNYRLTELQAALGLSQMKGLDANVKRRHVLAKQYDEQLKALPVKTPWQHPDTYSSYHLYVIQLDLHAIPHSHRAVFEAMRHKHIGVNLHYMPVHLQPYYAKMGFAPHALPHALAYYQKSISIPMYASMRDDQQHQVVDALKWAIAS